MDPQIFLGSNEGPLLKAAGTGAGTGGNWDDMTHGAGDASWDAPAGAGGAVSTAKTGVFEQQKMMRS